MLMAVKSDHESFLSLLFPARATITVQPVKLPVTRPVQTVRAAQLVVYVISADLDMLAMLSLQTVQLAPQASTNPAILASTAHSVPTLTVSTA